MAVKKDTGKKITDPKIGEKTTYIKATSSK